MFQMEGIKILRFALQCIYPKQILMTKAAHGTSGSIFAPGNRGNQRKGFCEIPSKIIKESIPREEPSNFPSYMGWILIFADSMAACLEEEGNEREQWGFQGESKRLICSEKFLVLEINMVLHCLWVQESVTSGVSESPLSATSLLLFIPEPHLFSAFLAHIPTPSQSQDPQSTSSCHSSAYTDGRNRALCPFLISPTYAAVELTLPSGAEWLGPLLTEVKGWELLGPNEVAHLQEKLGVQHLLFWRPLWKKKLVLGSWDPKKAWVKAAVSATCSQSSLGSSSRVEHCVAGREDPLLTWYLLYPLPQASSRCIHDKISIAGNSLNVNIFVIINSCNFRLQKYWEKGLIRQLHRCFANSWV